MFAEDPPDKILYCYGIYQELYREMEKTLPNITFLEGLPSPSETLLGMVIMHRVIRDGDMELLFTEGCHHRKISVVFITQNFFPKGTKSRTIALNTTYLVLMKNVRDVSQVATPGRQIFPGRSKILIEAYTDAVLIPFRYLVVDMSVRSEDDYRLRTQVFPEQDPIIYVPKNL